MTILSPYEGIAKSEWLDVTKKLVENHPLAPKNLERVVLQAWKDLFETEIGRNKLRIGHHIFPKPQVIGALLHELIPAEFSATDPKKWRGEESKDDKDIVYIPNDKFSIELKTSSNKNRIFGNRSYAQKPSASKKSKDGYYLAVNFEKFINKQPKPEILMIRFGWLDHSDWIGQKAASGQQARLAPETYDLKFCTLYTKR